MKKRSSRAMYYDQRKISRKRNIEFDITFEDWFAWWEATGKFHLRGPYVGNYVMARFNDMGAYRLGNIKCITVTENQNEGNIGRIHSEEIRKKCAGFKGRKHTKETLKKMSLSQSGKNNPRYGKKHSEETKRKMSLSAKARKRN